MKGKIGEEIEYERYIDRVRKLETANLADCMDIIPILNQEVGKRLVDQAKYWMVSSKTVATDEKIINR